MLTTEGWDPVVVSLYRGAIGLVFVLLWLVWRPGGSGLTSGRLWFWSVIAGIGVAGNFSFYFVSIAQGSVAVAVTLMYSAPIFVYLISFLFKLEKPTVAKWAAIILVVVGVVLLTGLLDIEGDEVTLIATLAGLLAGLSYALFIFGFKYAAPHGSPQAILVIAFAVLVGLLACWSDTDQMAAVWNAPHWPLFAILGVFGAGLSFFFYIVGLKHTAPTVAAMVALVEPVTAALFGVVVLNESIAALQVLGMAVILTTVTALSLSASAPVNMLRQSRASRIPSRKTPNV